MATKSLEIRPDLQLHSHLLIDFSALYSSYNNTLCLHVFVAIGPTLYYRRSDQAAYLNNN
jgi:hypothetical protein